MRTNINFSEWGVPLSTDYNCSIDIEFSGGDIQITVSGDEQTFAFKSGLGFMILPDLFWVLASFYKEEESYAKLECYGNRDYYNFVSDGTSIRIERVGHYPEGTDVYVFNLYKYVTAIDKAFGLYLKQLHREGILQLQIEEMGNPLGPNVMDAYNEFTTVLKS